MAINIETEIEAQAQEVEFISFSGGGAKGAIYSGVKKSLDKSGILKNVKVVAGSSAGAITASLIASGISNEDFLDISTNTNLKGLLGKGFIINKDGKPLYKLLQDNILKGISTYIQNNDIQAICSSRIEELASKKETFDAYEQLYTQKAESIAARKARALATNELNEEDLAKLVQEANDNNEALEEIRYRNSQVKQDLQQVEEVLFGRSEAFNDLKKRCSEKGKIYFKDLALMSAIDPERFKKLIVTAVRRDNSELVIFNAKSTPDVEVALACRASASIPLVFEPVEIELEIDGKKQKKQFVDGGYRDNIPTKYFGDATEDPKNKGRSIALAFGNQEDKDDSLHVALFSSQKRITNYGMLVSFIMDVAFKVMARIGGVFKYTEADEATAQEVRKKSHEVIPLNTRSVSTLSFDEAQAQSYYLHVKGQIETEKHLQEYDMVKASDPTLIVRECLLKAIEETSDIRNAKSWSNLAKEPLGRKTKELISFCEEDKWTGKDRSAILEEFVSVASLNRRTGKRSSDTNTIANLVKILNQRSTPDAFVKEFKQLIAKEEGKPFKKEDFDIIIKKQQHVSVNQNLMGR